MKILIVDTETTGLDTNAKACELAATLYEFGDSYPYRSAIASASSLLAFKGENQARDINGIDLNIAYNAQPVSSEILEVIGHLASKANYITSFSAEFDRPYWSAESLGFSWGLDLPWICAQTDFDWGYKFKERFKLVDLALWLGIGVSFSHRAGDDVRLLVECFNRIDRLEERFDRAIERSRSPWIELQAFVSFHEKELAKDANFSWDKQQKKWLKKIKECDRESFVSELNFEVGVLNAAV